MFTALRVLLALGVLSFAVAAIAFLISIAGYGHRQFDQTGGLLHGEGRFVVQVDDFGNYWDPAEAEKALAYVDKVSGETNTIVTVFVHGWHHNAAPADKNAVDFATSMNALSTRLGEDVYAKSRVALTGTADVKVVGIYIGWRGQSLPGVFDYLTFWGRKSAAERVGRGDVRELLLRLNALYADRNRRVANDRSPRTFMGLVLVGHSFGGQVLFQAVSQTLEQQLVAATPPTAEAPIPARELISGFGDLVVLLNPALEAHQYERIHTLSRRLTYDHQQVPLMFVLSAENDLARLTAFPLGRALDLLTKPSARHGQRGLWLGALGSHAPQVTHTVRVSSGSSNSFDPEQYTGDIDTIVGADLTHQPRFGGIELSPTGQHSEFHPFLVAKASPDIIRGHSGIFPSKQERAALESKFHNFLTNYVAVVQGKRMLIARGHGTATR